MYEPTQYPIGERHGNCEKSVSGKVIPQCDHDKFLKSPSISNFLSIDLLDNCLTNGNVQFTYYYFQKIFVSSMGNCKVPFFLVSSICFESACAFSELDRTFFLPAS